MIENFSHLDAEISAGNPWYSADQFRAQLGSPGRRKVIENRWRVFGEMIKSWGGAVGASTLRVLDAGCGDGINLVGLRHVSAGQLWSLDVTGVDYNMLRLERARTNAPEAMLNCASISNLPFANSSFDVVLCNHVIEHIPDFLLALAELFRTLRNGGLLIVGVPNEGCIMALIRNHWVQPAIGRETDHVNFFTHSTLSSALVAAGFVVCRVELETFFFPHSYFNAVLNEFAVGHWLMAVLRRLFPSQAGGLIAAAVKPAGASCGGCRAAFKQLANEDAGQEGVRFTWTPEIGPG